MNIFKSLFVYQTQFFFSKSKLLKISRKLFLFIEQIFIKQYLFGEQILLFQEAPISLRTHTIFQEEDLSVCRTHAIFPGGRPFCLSNTHGFSWDTSLVINCYRQGKISFSLTFTLFYKF